MYTRKANALKYLQQKQQKQRKIWNATPALSTAAGVATQHRPAIAAKIASIKSGHKEVGNPNHCQCLPIPNAAPQRPRYPSP
jgi:hypothetical protein